MISDIFGIWLILILITVTFLSIPVFILLKLIGSFYNGKNRILYKLLRIVNKRWIELIYTILVIGICIIGLALTFDGVKAGEPLSMYEQSSEYINSYASLSLDHIPTILIFFILSLLAYILLRSYSEKLSPVIYTVCCSLLILNILFTAAYYYHTSVNFHEVPSSLGFEVWYLRLGFLYLSLLYIIELKNSLDKFIKKIVPGDSHYLCTVSVKGHKKLVKPLKSGIRGTHIILVNRQLLIANAFENILEQYTPKLHKIIRDIYDKYGYPLSKHINTSWSADLVYILMKPLEWFFLLILYTVEQNPENRINVQYSELRKRRLS